MLMDVTSFKPMYYIGLTLDTRDEIDSQVVVDFGEAFADAKRRKAWEPTIGGLNTAKNDATKSECMSPCCFGQAVHDGDNIDDKMTENFVKTLIPSSSLREPSLILSPRTIADMQRPGNEPTEEECVIMTYRVFGFVLRSRKWAQLDLTFLRYENAGARELTVDAFERLQLPPGHREVVKSLITQHFRHKQTKLTSDGQTDLIKGKGKGLIILLHGAPGVGKTTTAKGIAELFRKPLFQITCGDLGTTAREVEAELEKNFSLASRWGCILLLDEADVFLSARERNDFNRNGLVAVFLRILEYYSGILFLTTNRIGDFDEAFASRIHMSLYYPALDEEKTIKVFKLNLELIKQRFDQQDRQIIFDESSIEFFARQHFSEQKYNRWNGRQIRNACQTALALAEFDAQGGEIDAEVDVQVVVNLQLKHFKIVQTAYLDFGKYLGDIRGTQGDRRAIDLKYRARTDTPYETKPSLFSQRSDAFRSAGGDWVTNSPPTNPQYQAQSDPFQPLVSQVYASPNMPQMQGQYQQQLSQQQIPRTFMENSSNYMGLESPIRFGQGNQQSQTDPRLMQNHQTQMQPQNSFQQAQNARGIQPGMNFNGSPMAQNVQVQQFGYSQGNQGGQPPSIPMQGSSMQGPLGATNTAPVNQRGMPFEK